MTLLPCVSRDDLLAELAENTRDLDRALNAVTVSPEAEGNRQAVVRVLRWWDRELRADLEAQVAAPESSSSEASTPAPPGGVESAGSGAAS